MAKPKQPTSRYRKQASNVTISFAGFLSMVGDLFTARETGADDVLDFKSLCPVCDMPVKQLLECSHDTTHPHPSSYQTCHKGSEQAGTIVVLDPVELARLRDPDTHGLVKNLLQLQIFHRKDVELLTFPDPTGVAYVFTPTGDTRLYGLLRRLLTDRDDIVFMGRMNLKNAEKIMEVTFGLGGQLIIRSLIPPCDVREFDYVDVEIDETMLVTLDTAIEASIEEFREDSFRPIVRDKVNEFIVASMPTSGKTLTAVSAPVTVPVTDDLAALLAASAARVTEV